MDLIKSKVVGILTQQSSQDWWRSEKVAISLFSEMESVIEFFRPDADSHGYLHKNVDQLLGEFLELNVDKRNAMSQEVYRHCQEFFLLTGFNEEVVEMFRQVDEPQKGHLDAVRLGELLHLEDVNNVWEFVSLSGLYVRSGADDKDNVFIRGHLKCDWDEEHGLDMIFESGWTVPKIEVPD